MTSTMQASAREIGEALIASQRATGRAKPAALEAFRAACRASRELHGSDLHEIVKAAAIAGATGGRG